eukprot:gene1950-2386_t
MFTDQRKDKVARLYLEKRTKILEWIKDCFNKNGEPIDQSCNDLIDLIYDDGGIKSRRIKRKEEFSNEELARAHMELVAHREATGESLSVILADSLPVEELANKSMIQYQVSNSNSYDSKDYSIVDTIHQRTTIVNPKNTGGSNGYPTPISTPLTRPQQSIQQQPRYQEVATTSTIKTASISTSPIPKRPTNTSSFMSETENQILSSINRNNHQFHHHQFPSPIYNNNSSHYNDNTTFYNNSVNHLSTTRNIINSHYNDTIDQTPYRPNNSSIISLFCKDQLIGSGQVEMAAIISAADGGVWASSPSNFLKSNEGSTIKNLFSNPAEVFATGVTVGGIKYMGIKGDNRSIYGKKGATGVILVKTNQTIIVGFYNEKQQPGNASNVTEKLADYLIDNGY